MSLPTTPDGRSAPVAVAVVRPPSPADSAKSAQNCPSDTPTLSSRPAAPHAQDSSCSGSSSDGGGDGGPTPAYEPAPSPTPAGNPDASPSLASSPARPSTPGSPESPGATTCHLQGIAEQSNTNKKPPSSGLPSRRSVLSMKTLLPLSLPTASSSPSSLNSTPSRQETESPQPQPNSEVEPEIFGPDLCNLPEMLVRDLELSSALFQSKNLSAGPPMACLAAEDMERPPPLPPLPSFILQSPFGSPRTSSDADAPDSPRIPRTSDSESESAHSAADSARVKPSAATAAATTTTTAMPATSDNGARPTPPSPDRSIWIENDSDGGGSDDEEPDANAKVLVLCSSQLRSRSPPPPRPESSRRKKKKKKKSERRPPDINTHSAAAAAAAAPSLPRMSFTNPFDSNARIPASRLSRPSSGISARSPSRRRPSAERRPVSQHEVEIPQRRSSLSHRVSSDMPSHQRPPVAPLYDPEDALVSPTISRATSVRTPNTSDFSFKGLTPAPPPSREIFAAAPRRDFTPPSFESPRNRRPASPRRHTMKAPPTSHPRVNIQTWLDSSVPHHHHHHARDLSEEYPHLRCGAVPLPPDVLDTLRISTACFPETMLLTSSLSIDTIRAYSRKFKNPTRDRPPSDPTRPALAAVLSLPLPPPQPAPRRWPWTRVLSSSTSIASKKSAHSRSEPDPAPPPPDAAAPSWDRPAWMALKNVFGPSASDYLCDALYAHVVAYNYISAVCARLCPPPSPHYASLAVYSRPSSASRHPPKTPSTIVSDDDDDDDEDSLLDVEPDSASTNEIPRKAASLLGLADAYTQGELGPRLSMRHPERKSSVAVLREALMSGNAHRQRDQPQPSPGFSPTDGALKALHSGLGRCIARLVATLKTADDNGQRDVLLVEDVVEVDALFMRSLCEIVRCCEDTLGP